MREMILQALDDVGGPEYLAKLAVENSSAFSSLLAKVLPSTLTSDSDGGGVGVELRFVREVVWPDGRREIEGVTPKQLPAPEPDETKAIEP